MEATKAKKIEKMLSESIKYGWMDDKTMSLIALVIHSRLGEVQNEQEKEEQSRDNFQ